MIMLCSAHDINCILPYIHTILPISCFNVRGMYHEVFNIKSIIIWRVLNEPLRYVATGFSVFVLYVRHFPYNPQIRRIAAHRTTSLIPVLMLCRCRRWYGNLVRFHNAHFRNLFCKQKNHGDHFLAISLMCTQFPDRINSMGAFFLLFSSCVCVFTALQAEHNEWIINTSNSSKYQSVSVEQGTISLIIIALQALTPHAKVSCEHVKYLSIKSNGSHKMYIFIRTYYYVNKYYLLFCSSIDAISAEWECNFVSHGTYELTKSNR